MKPLFQAGNRITLLEAGGQFFPALMGAIQSAQHYIHVETYMFVDDEVGRSVTNALIGAVQRGVKVHVLVDGFGSPDFLSTLGGQLINAGGQVMIYRPEVAPLRLRRHRLRRLHRKIAVIDGRIAFVGGINIVADTDGTAPGAPRLDYAVAVEGPLLGPITHATQLLWRLVRWASFRKRPPKTSDGDVSTRPAGDITAAFVVRDNLRHRRDIEDAYLDAFAQAGEEIILASAYFLPGRRFRRALMDAVQRGVRVVVLLQGRIDHAVAYYASQALYGQLIAGGVIIHEYRANFLHAKVAVVDCRWATVGSSNIDPFSLLLAREANVIVRHSGFAKTLRSSLKRAIGRDSVVIQREDLRKRSLLTRAASWLAYGLVRLAVGIAGLRGRDFGG